MDDLGHPVGDEIILPLGILTFFSIGIASVTTMAVAFFAIVVFAFRASQGLMIIEECINATFNPKLDCAKEGSDSADS